MRVLALEPYYGGSHRAFLDHWAKQSRHDWTILGLPPHHWKWRMRHAPITFANQLKKEYTTSSEFDLLFCSDMLSLAPFKGLASKPFAQLPTVCYFHENQLSYPDRFKTERDHHYGFDNLMSCLAADKIWFNSHFHLTEFLAAAKKLISCMPDYNDLNLIDSINQKSEVCPPAVQVDLSFVKKDSLEAKYPSEQDFPLHIVWAARWEHDKNPEDFFAALFQLKEKSIPFQVSVMGESFRQSPTIFENAREKLQHQIVHWGFLERRVDYLAALNQADVFVSTAQHEFFGISAVEAVLCGNLPLLPQRLAYPELLALKDDPASAYFFYDGSLDHLVNRLIELAQEKKNQSTWAKRVHLAQEKLQRFLWSECLENYDSKLQQITDAATFDLKKNKL